MDGSLGSRRTRKRGQTLEQCEHSCALSSLSPDFLLESVRFSRAACNCDESFGSIRLCLACGSKVCTNHDVDQHCQKNSHGVLLDVASLSCECRLCRKAVMVEGCAEALAVLDPTMSVGLGLRGLYNSGNICFMNAVLQSLSNTSEFRDLVLRMAAQGGTKPAIPNQGQSLFRSWAGLLARLWNESDIATEEIRSKAMRVIPDSTQFPTDYGTGPIDPRELMALIKHHMPIFGDASQHDAHEFLRFFSDNLQAEYPGSTDMFGGSFLSEVTCLRCNLITRKIDPCLDLSLDFPSDMHLSIILREGKAHCARPIRLLDCLNHFSRIEHIVRGNDDACKLCQPSQSTAPSTSSSLASTPPPEVVATKRLRLLTMPKVLVIHFKRFKWSFYSSCTKIPRYVQFPLKGLVMKEFAAKDSSGAAFGEDEGDGVVYDLVSVVVHHGRAMGNGHYTAYSLNCADHRWYHYNDTIVTPVDDEVVARAEAYLLFYEKRHT